MRGIRWVRGSGAISCPTSCLWTGGSEPAARSPPRCTRPLPLRVLFDDYAPRRHYHGVEAYIGPPRRMIGRMAEFEIEPMTLPQSRLSDVIEMMLRP